MVKKNIPTQQRRSDAYIQMGQKLRQMSRFDGTVQCYQKALGIKPDNLEALRKLSSFLERINRIDAAQEIVAKGLKLYPQDHMLNFTATKLDRRNGRYEEAINRLSGFIHLDLEDKVLQRFHFELGHLYDLKGDSEKAFDHFQKGNRYAAADAEAKNLVEKSSLEEIHRLRTMCEHPGFAASFIKKEKVADDMPIFLIGFPRSGTTLLDQILDNHSRLQVLEEAPALQVVKKSVEEMPEGFPDALQKLGDDDLLHLRHLYFDQVATHLARIPGSKLIDKMPLNIINVPSILKLFPDAKFILAMRHPYDVCLSCFMQNFRLNESMVNFLTLEKAARFYCQVMALWQMYEKTWPLSVHMVKLEEVTVDPENQLRPILEFLDVPWEEGVLGFKENALKRMCIQTPSYHQVVEPVNTKGLYRWQRYKKQMAGVLESLKPFADYFGYDGTI